MIEPPDRRRLHPGRYDRGRQLLHAGGIRDGDLTTPKERGVGGTATNSRSTHGPVPVVTQVHSETLRSDAILSNCR